ncbi:Exopolysaccharide inner membrane protein [Pseudomonas viridiflava]|uniref:Exopolysaccharide inner membrane protein n=2 Tax=Pseudomonas viridiflava TaxID=33069 RepID=A0A3M5PFN8_PSEVI|nr:Exopolysaccharide inner membrane protein [Pseudomonas viridiflava]
MFMSVHCHAAQAASPFTHPGLLHSQQDFERVENKVAHHEQPWSAGWQTLTANRHASLDWKPNPQAIVYRGLDHQKHKENYSALFNDAATAYALALRWKISHDNAYAEKAIDVLNQWSSTLTSIEGSGDRYLASGLYGYEFANAAEILRNYPRWAPADFQRFQNMMLTKFYPMNHDFLIHHDNALVDHHWANWDLANMNAMLAIGVLSDRRDIYNEAVNYFKNGAGNGAIKHVVWHLYNPSLGQVQESGRDQAHTMLDIALLGSFCQMAWNQGDDLFGYDNNRVLAGAEYAARYNLGYDVPFTPYTKSIGTQVVISDKYRRDERPVWELLYNHYVVLKRLKAPHVEAFAKQVRVEGGGGNYSPNSGGYDQLGYGTLMFSLQHL